MDGKKPPAKPLNDAEEFLMKLHTNTKRKNLSDLELCEAMSREKEIYETFYPDTKHGQNKSGPNEQFVRTENPAYASLKAKELGVTPTSVRRNVKVGQVVQEIPELKEAKATKMEAYALARRKPEERQLVQKALQTAVNKPETLRQFTRHEPKQSQESDADYAYRYFKDDLRLFRKGIDWEQVCMVSRIFELEQDLVLLELSDLARAEHQRITKAAQMIREKYC